ncbi:MAG: arsenate reductase [Novosphingobium sp. 28-62-57]|uniref:arsenate reductase n=1 Tax=unclassified Novosphingobium TaxID=2644732 RepID=UPI000BD1CB73|nr:MULTISPECIES: arsenate reductase [unclassified Novosphingobium]OYW50151.1 MAG: arsenate reductase [Novosphingobium sp. 12-62-10]OYZ11744.1 MAG: arsenate reductase [Novosphingobium sp. 28-62-57]OYZ23142.1 MAG: arsenate reductase [Novosphingobium sp. 16-62-11]OZA33762.1 MAG: arsenate reductase [Novosphingobium sp. 17-62-9]
MSITVYGIPNCDTVKKARNWLDSKGISYTFHDYKKQGADPAKIAEWIAVAGLDKVVNKAGTTYRKLDEAQKAELGGEGAPAVLAEHTSVIKRPILEHSDGVLVGFKEVDWVCALG